MNYQVETGIPIPAPNYRGGRGRPAKYPWANLQIGDSFFVKCEEGETPRSIIRRLVPTACHAGEARAMKFTCRSMEDGVRVWRVA